MSHAPVEHLDVLIVGAGLSGIGAAATLVREHPEKSYALVEARSASGGTWDLFRYPGVRSDSDMYTLGYRFKPWPGQQALADGPSILAYVRETAAEYGVDRHIRYEHRVTAADWDSAEARWTVTVQHGDQTVEMTCSLLWVCSGYYDYAAGHRPHFPGEESFGGALIHPQHWPEGLDYTGKRVVVIGSGATAVTLVPAMAPAAAHVTMLQRTPSYVLSVPQVDPVAAQLGRRLSAQRSYDLVRWKSILVAIGLYQFSRKAPGTLRRLLRLGTQKALPEGYDVATHFTPPYDPWDQRMCFVPDGDLFKVLSDGSAEVVTDTVETFTPTGIRLASGRELEADVVVAATGLCLLAFGGAVLSVDGAEVRLPETMAYKALMLAGVPNLVYTVGYTNASWTLKADLVADFVARLLSFLDEHGYRTVVPMPDDTVAERPFMDLESGYVLRSLDHLPKQGDRAPWLLKQNYLADRRLIRRGSLTDGVLHYGS
ncbi:MAG: NAD(P)/FAD-dependent oxidoreductase [Nocardioides sp.]|uniref:flavin-containing monooxygenase n=1 Tax=Nocardioides sp. TaxID=35761 RepID=UPI0039E269E5